MKRCITRRKFALIVYMLTLCFKPLSADFCIGLATTTDYIGDREAAWRIKIAGEMLGWTVIVDETGGRQIQNMEDLDCMISLLPKNKILNPHCPNLQVIFHPFGYLDKNRQLEAEYEKYDGYLLTIRDRESIAKGFKKKHKEFHYIPFYPSVAYVPFCEVPLKEIATMIPAWSERKTSKKFRQLYSLLDRSGHVKFYGKLRNSEVKPKGYLGLLPFDGVSVINALKQHGITLIIHSSIHNDEKIPSGRIFEAAAASTVIISDNNPFVKEHFGDSVFYIDTTASAQTICNEIMEHLEYIYQNPEIAHDMAKRAHQIFVDRFEMTLQLLELEALTRRIVEEKSSDVQGQ